MPLTPELTRTARKVSLGFLLKTLEREYVEREASEARQPHPERWEIDLFWYYHTAVYVGAHWINGCPFSYKFPRAYQGERLAKLCAYLQKAEKLHGGALELERDRQTDLLRTQTWPAYAKACTGMNHDASGGCTAELTYTWSGIDTLWSEQNLEEAQDAPPSYLPKFHSLESEAFHCNALAVLYLNRATKRPLTDLDITPF